MNTELELVTSTPDPPVIVTFGRKVLLSLQSVTGRGPSGQEAGLGIVDRKNNLPKSTVNESTIEKTQLV